MKQIRRLHLLDAIGRRRERHLDMGRHSYGVPRVVTYGEAAARVRVGAFTSIAEEVQIVLGGNHSVHTVSTFPFRLRWQLPGARADGMPFSKGDVRIGNDVWIGRGAMVLSGVTVGDGAVIGARAVVASDVRPYAIVAGNPAREVRRRFPDEVVAALLAIRWWEWSDADIAARLDDLNREPVERFVERYSPRPRA